MKKSEKSELDFFYAYVSPYAAENKGNWKSIVLAALFFIWETVIFYFYFKGFLHVSLFILLHLVPLVISFLFLFFEFIRKQDVRYPLLLFAALLGGGPFGMGGFLLFSVLRLFYSLFALPMGEWFKELFPEAPTIYGNVFERIRAGWDDYSQKAEIIPFKDIFDFGTLSQKQAVLDALVKDFKPIYAPILKMALNDASSLIRIQAAAIVSRLDAEFEEKVKVLLHEQSVGDPKTSLTLAQHFDTFAFTGLLDPIRERENQEQALYFYQEYLKASPDDRNTWFAVGRILFRKKDFQQVVNWFDEYKEKFEGLDGKAYSWYLEALYMLHQYTHLSESAKGVLEIMRRDKVPPPILESVEGWAKGD